MIIGLANSKGGVSKSTIARNAITYLCDRGIQTALVDAEKGAPTARLLNKFDSKIETRAAETLDEIDDAVHELTDKGLHVVIDAPGKEGDQVLTLCLLSDLVIIPICISEQDLLQTVGIMRLVLRQQKHSGNNKPDAAIVFTRTLKDDIAAPKFKLNLAKIGIPIAKSEIREMVAVKRNVSVMRHSRFYRNNGPANDFKSLVDEVILPRLRVDREVANE